MNLREMRELHKLTQPEAAKRGGLEQTTISQLDLGKVKDPRHSTLQALASAYGVGVQDIVDALAESLQQAEGA